MGTSKENSKIKILGAMSSLLQRLRMICHPSKLLPIFLYLLVFLGFVNAQPTGLQLTGLQPTGLQSSALPGIQQATHPIELCEKAKTAGFIQHGRFLLNPRDFQVLALQPVVQPYLRRLELTLNSQNINLVPIVLPPRGVIFPTLGEESRRDYAKLISDLATANINSVALSRILDIYSADFFFDKDHHWTPFAAREVAKLVDGTLNIPAESRQSFESFQIRHNWSPGDSRLKALAKLCNYNYQKQDSTYMTSDYVTSEYVTSWVTEMSTSAGLFDTRDVSNQRHSALVGTSNSESSTLNFAGFLSEQTGQSISNYSFASSGALGSMLHYFLSREYEQSKPRYLFWEFLANPHTTDYNLNSIHHYRQIIPSIFGACKGAALASASYTLDSAANRSYIDLFQNAPQLTAIDGPNYYLSFQISGNFIDRVIVETLYANGQLDQSVIALLPSASGLQKTFLEFLNPSLNNSGSVSQINISFPSPSHPSALTHVNVDLCSTN